MGVSQQELLIAADAVSALPGKIYSKAMSALDHPVLFFPDEQSLRARLVDDRASVDRVWPRFGIRGPVHVSLNQMRARRMEKFADGQKLG
ncbi:hypothetical protein [Nocardia sp. NPDC057440]|uniref:hypothetical protein n=1 Tax=Nocardia sp. NPDC057440 TaxID=3346134 RepID=UPI00366AEBBA